MDHRTRYYHDLLGVNSRLDTIQAAILRVKLKYLDRWNRQRQDVAGYYTTKLDNSRVVAPFIAGYASHIFHQYTIQVEEKRDALQKHLSEMKIPNAIYYPIPLHMQAAYQKTSHYKPGDFPVSEKMAHRVISLPMHPDLAREEQDYIVEAINKFFSD